MSWLSHADQLITALEVGALVFGVVTGAGAAVVVARGTMTVGRFLVKGWVRRRAVAFVGGFVVGWATHTDGEQSRPPEPPIPVGAISCADVVCAEATLGRGPVACAITWREAGIERTRQFDGETALESRIQAHLQDLRPQRVCIDTGRAGVAVAEYWADAVRAVGAVVQVDGGACDARGACSESAP